MSARNCRAVLKAALPFLFILIMCSMATVLVVSAARMSEAAALESAVSASGLPAVIAQPDAECRSCHVEKTTYYDASAHANLVCTSCHGAHDGPSQRAGLLDSISVLCRECHGAALGRAHVADGECEDKLAGKPLTCVSSCHDPHGTEFESMVRVPADGLCVQCHEDIGKWQ